MNGDLGRKEGGGAEVGRGGEGGEGEEQEGEGGVYLVLEDSIGSCFEE